MIRWAHPLSKGLTGAWFFNEKYGNRVRNLVAQGVADLVFGGTSAFRTTTVHGYGVNSGQGSSNGMWTAALPAHMKTDAATLFWFGQNIGPTGVSTYPLIASVRYNSTDTSPYDCLTMSCDAGASTTVSFATNAAGVSKFFTQANAWAVNKFMSLAIVHPAAGTCRGFKNGTFLNVVSGGGVINYTATSYLAIGSSGQTDLTESSGGINHVLLLYNRALSDNEIAMLALDPWCVYPRRVIYYRRAKTTATITPAAGRYWVRGKIITNVQKRIIAPSTGRYWIRGNVMDHSYTPGDVFTNFVTVPKKGVTIFGGGSIGQAVERWRKSSGQAKNLWRKRI